jgi:hypothetical protein
VDFYTEPFLSKREKEKETEKKKPEDSHPGTPPIKKTTSPDATAKTTPAIKKPSPVVNKPATNNPVVKNNPPKKPLKKTEEKQALVKTNTEKHTVQSPKMDSIFKSEHKFAPIVLPQVLASRKNELVKTITVNTNEIELNIYDDGAIDHDTVSVYVDKKLVISHAMLTDRAIVMKLHLDDTDDYHEVVMVAENEGEIPPNTSLMVVKAGDKQYEVRIVSTEQKNATVIFKYEKAK